MNLRQTSRSPTGITFATQARGGVGMPNPDPKSSDKIMGVDKKTAAIGAAVIIAALAFYQLNK